MMRKLIFGVLFAAATGFCFGQIKGNIEFYGGAALFNETSALNEPETIYNSISVSAGVSAGIDINERVGLKAYMDFLLPVSFTARSFAMETLKQDDYDFLLGLDEFLGVVFTIAKTNRFTIPITAGFHGKLLFSTLSGDLAIKAASGLGIGIGAEYAFTDNVYLLVRMNGSFDFIGFGIKDTKMDMAFIQVWGFAPHIGIGIKL
jgi:opacity protein-like surface antigen